MFHGPLRPASASLSFFFLSPTFLSTSTSFFLPLFKEENSVEAYPPPPCCTSCRCVNCPAVAVVLCLVAVPVIAALVVAVAALVAVVAVATPVVFDVAAVDFPADVASVVAAAFHPASVVGVDTVASAPMGHSTREERLQIFAPYLSPSAII